MTVVIGFTGLSDSPDGSEGSGKSTVSHMVQEMLEAHGLNVVRLSFAGPLKEICYSVYGIAYGVKRSAFYGTQAQKNEPIPQLPGWTGRKIMMHVGETFKSVAGNVWAKLLTETAKKGSIILVDDVRFLVEYEAIKEIGGTVVLVKRTSGEKQPSVPVDYVLDNQGRSLVELSDLVRSLLCELRFLPSIQRQQD